MRLLGLLLVALLTASVALSAPAAHAAAAKPGRECFPGSERSLVVKGKLGCQKAIRLRDATVERAAVAKEERRKRFNAKGFRCRIISGDFAYTCRDRTPNRSFTVRF